MVGLLSGMDNEALSSVSQKDKDVNVGSGQEEANVQEAADETQAVAGNTDNVDEVEHVKELKSILKRRGQYTFRKVKVDFELYPAIIPYNEDDYTVEIQIIEKEPVRIKSWAAIFAAKKAEAEAEAAAIAEADEALKKAEEQQKREALKKANKAKLKKSKEYSESSEETGTSVLTEQHEQVPTCNIGQVEQTIGQIEPEVDDTTISTGTNVEELNEQGKSSKITEHTRMEEISGLPAPCTPALDYQIAECIINEVLDTATIPEDLVSQNVNLERIAREQEDNEGSSCTESLIAEKSEDLREEHTNSDLKDISTQEEGSMSQLLEDANVGSGNYVAKLCHNEIHRTKLEDDSPDEDASALHSEENSSNISHLEDSSKLVELQDKKVPKKVLVTATSLVEDILSEMPNVMQTELKDSESNKESIPISNKKKEITTSPQKYAAPELPVSITTNDLKNKNNDVNLESSARRKRREFKKSNDSKIYEHVRKSLESAAPDILETAVGVLNEIENVVVDRVGSAIS